MSDDAITLIAEARRRQEAAEQSRDSAKRRAAKERARVKLLVGMIRRAPIKPPDIDAAGNPEWQDIERVVQVAADVFCDPYAQFPEEDDLSLSHDQARLIMAYRLQDMIEAAVKKAKAE